MLSTGTTREKFKYYRQERQERGLSVIDRNDKRGLSVIDRNDNIEV